MGCGRSRWLLLFAPGLAANTAARAAAQAPTDSLHAARGRAAGVELWVGLARHSPQLGPLGDTPGLNLGLVALRWTRRVRARPALALDYTADLLPAVLLSPPYAAGNRGGPPSGPPACAVCLAGRADGGSSALFPRGSAYGLGASPLGVTAVFRPGRRIEPTLGATGGVVWLDRREPTTAAARLNFTATAEAGMRVRLPRGPRVTLAYRFHHLSNGGTAPDNYAVASHVLSVGLRWPGGRRAPDV